MVVAFEDPAKGTNVTQFGALDEGWLSRLAHDSWALACYPVAMAKKKATKKKSAAKKALSFEHSMDALKEILADLEAGNLPLNESLEKYEAGIRHLRECDATLRKAKAKIELLVGVDGDGQPVTKPFEHSATHEESGVVSEEVSEGEAQELQDELDEEGDEDGDWDGGLF